jgi:nitrate reductase NapD
MNICSLIVHARPEDLGRVQQGLEALPGVEVHGTSEEGKLVVTVEDEAGSPAADTVMGIQNLSGVINAVLIYHYGGDEPLGEEVIRESH